MAKRDPAPGYIALGEEQVTPTLDFYEKSELVNGWKAFINQMVKDALMDSDVEAKTSFGTSAKEGARYFFTAPNWTDQGKWRDYIFTVALGYENPTEPVSKIVAIIDSGVSWRELKKLRGIK